MWSCLFFFFLVFFNLQVYTVLAGSLVRTGIEAIACDLWGALWVLPPPTLPTTSSEHSTAGVTISHTLGKGRQRSYGRIFGYCHAK